MPTIPMRTPEPIVDDRSVDINRFYHIVGTIDIVIANNLYRDLLRCLVFFNIDACHILVDVFCENGLNHDEMG